VVAHVDGCADCRSELELLRSVRSSLERGTPRVDLDRIVAALPSPATVGRREHGRAWRVLHDWRIAAAVTFIVAGGTSLVVVRNVRDGGTDSASAPAARQVANAASESTATATAPSTGSAVRSSAPGPTTAPAPHRPRGTAPVLSRGGTDAVASKDEQNAGLGNSHINDLNERQLKSLLDAIEHMDATPVTEPEPVTLHVGSRTSSPTGL
jgi:hypothetical protein